MTEQTAASIIHRTDDIRLDTVGKPLPGLEFKVSDSGELLSRGDTIFNVMKLGDGSKFSPQLIENKLRFSPYIIDAVVIGQERPFITAMIAIDMANVGKWAENNQIAFTTFTDISQKEETYDLIAGEVAKTNTSLPKVAKIRKFVLLYKELDADDDELTRTRKVRRKFVADRYKTIIEAMYSDAEEIHVEADIRYQDGKAFKMKTGVKIRQVEPAE